jgi:hypothetical protein
MGIIPILPGSTCSLWWVPDSSGRFRAKDYFDNLNASDRAKFQVLFERMQTVREIRNIEHFRKEPGNISCFKRGQHRLACFRQGNDLMLVNGFRKKNDKDKRSKRHIETAERIRTEYLDQHAKE